MPPKQEATITFDFKKISIILGVLATIGGSAVAGYNMGSTYHLQFAQAELVDTQIVNLNKEIITLAIQQKEDDLSLIEFKQATGSATDLDTADKANIIRRIDSLQIKLDKL